MTRRGVVLGRDRSRALLALVVASAIWGSTFVVTERLLEEAEPFFISAVRFVLALALLLPLVRRPYTPSARSFLRPAFVALGLLGVAVNFGLQNVGLAYTDAADAALIIALTPVPIAVLAAIFLGESLGARRLSGIAVSIAGVILITRAAGGASDAALLGDLLIAASTLAWAGYTVVAKRVAPAYNPAWIAVAGIGWGILFLLPLALAETLVVSPPELSPVGVGALIYLGVAASAVTFLLWNYGLESVGASVAGVFLNLVPAFGLAFAFLAGESISHIQLAGGAVVGCGVWLASTSRDGGPSGSADRSSSEPETPTAALR